MVSKESDSKSGLEKKDDKKVTEVEKPSEKTDRKSENSDRKSENSDKKDESVISEEKSSISDSVEKCSICSEGMFKAEDTLSTKCGHKFHKKCVLKWFRNHTICPVDRRECSVKFVGEEVDSRDTTLAERLKLKVSVLDNFSIGNFFTQLKFDPGRKTDLLLIAFANMRPELAATNFCIESNVVVSLDGVILTVMKHWTPENDPMDDDLIIRGGIYLNVDRIIFSVGLMDRSLSGNEQYKNFIADTSPSPSSSSSSAQSKAHKERFEKFTAFIRETTEAAKGMKQ